MSHRIIILNRINDMMGYVDENGFIWDRLNNKRGKVDEQGIIRELTQTRVGKVLDDGSVRNHAGQKLGQVEANGKIRAQTSLLAGTARHMEAENPQDLYRAGGGALLLLLRDLYENAF